MIFLHPHWLALLALPVILAFWEWIRRGQPIALPFDHGKQRRGLVLRFLVLCANCLPATLLALAIIFLAHPVTFLPPEVERKLNNVQIVLDTSGSMAEPHGSQAAGRHRRFDSAMDAIEKFINYRKGGAFGLSIFSRHSSCPRSESSFSACSRSSACDSRLGKMALTLLLGTVTIHLATK